MPILRHPQWNEQDGVCGKHFVPCVPCPSCLAGDGDEDLVIQVTEMDRLIMDMEDVPLRDLIPKNLVARFDRGQLEIW